jgi:acyl carrier protein
MIAELHDIIVKLFPQAAKLEKDQPIFSSGLIDSFGVLEIIAELEEKYGINIDTGVVQIEQLDSISKIEILINKLK